jgi:hypothetical protein
MRTNIPALFTITIFINIGMWFERFVIIVTSLAHEYEPWQWRNYQPSLGRDGHRRGQLRLVLHVVPAVPARAARRVGRGAEGSAAGAAARPRARRAAPNHTAGSARGGGDERPKTQGTLGVYDAVDAASRTIERLRAAGMKRITVFSPVPSHELEHALHAGESPVRIFTLVGGLTGAATGFAMADLDVAGLAARHRRQADHLAAGVGHHRLRADHPVRRAVHGGRPVHHARLPQRRVMQVYDPSFSSDRFGVLVMPPAGRESQVRDIMRDNGAAEIREQVQEVKVGDL